MYVFFMYLVYHYMVLSENKLSWTELVLSVNQTNTCSKQSKLQDTIVCVAVIIITATELKPTRWRDSLGDQSTDFSVNTSHLFDLVSKADIQS